jgi:toxin-antitoxin system PIN domain toxin
VILPDVNVLVHAHRKDLPRHRRFRQWLSDAVNGDQAYAMSDAVIAGFVRVVTHPRVFKKPSTIEQALGFASRVVLQPHCVRIGPGPRHFEIFSRLCRQAETRGSLVWDAFHAALAIEHGCEWITTDRDFSRFEGLRWRHPLQG